MNAHALALTLQVASCWLVECIEILMGSAVVEPEPFHLASRVICGLSLCLGCNYRRFNTRAGTSFHEDVFVGRCSKSCMTSYAQT